MVTNSLISNLNKGLITAPGPRGHWLYGSIREMLRNPLNFYLQDPKSYGDIIHFPSLPFYSWYLISHPDDIEYILYKNQQNYPKGNLFNQMVGVLLGEGLLTSE